MMSSPVTEGNKQNFSENDQQGNTSIPIIFTAPYEGQQPPTFPQFTHALLFHQIFLKGKPKPLGIVLIVAAILQVALGIAGLFTTFAVSIVMGIPFWGSVFYIIAGSLTIAAQVAPNICLVKGSLGLNIITAIVSFIGFILTCVDLFVIDNFPDYEYYINGSRAGGSFVLAILLITNLLLFSVSISVSVFGCQALCHSPSNASQIFLVQNDTVIAAPPPPYGVIDIKSPTVE
ncbi:membrane-spanning 4-domains subfamily A member 4A-like [Hyla sarda]|uniref:membrane-spanning 4-domains subfamily A member 4A-like n=1 Tax=Hyla sarda TaxID=327740 RepID=UPI0024C3BB2A|nr:membrane-spanning 4-domains subfamily A member 4A-like [Hyla sarda]